MFTNLRKTHPEWILRIMMKWLINMCQNMEINPLVIIVIWYQLLCFSTQIHFKVCWWIMQLHRWVALTIFRILLHVPKLWGEMVLLNLFWTFPNVSLSVKQILLQQHLLTRHRWSHFIQRWVSRLLKISQHLLILKRLTSDLIVIQENLKHCRNKQLAYNFIKHYHDVLQFFMTI